MTLIIKGSRRKNRGQMEPHGESEVDMKRQLPEHLVLGAVASGNISWSGANIGMKRFMMIEMTLMIAICLINANCNEHLSKYITMKCADIIADQA